MRSGIWVTARSAGAGTRAPSCALCCAWLQEPAQPPARPCGGPGGVGVGWVLPARSSDTTQHITLHSPLLNQLPPLHDGFGALPRALNPMALGDMLPPLTQSEL